MPPDESSISQQQGERKDAYSIEKILVRDDASSPSWSDPTLRSVGRYSGSRRHVIISDGDNNHAAV